jgi:dipeptidyl aminopeptidase/acylaminoacyl peptidase
MPSARIRPWLILLTLVAASGVFVFHSAAPAVAPPASDKGKALTPSAPASPAEVQQAYSRANKINSLNKGKMFRAKVAATWLPDNKRFWYRNDLRGGAREFILVDAEHGVRQAAFDHARLAASLSKAAAKEYKADHLPFDAIQFVDADKALQFQANGATWKCLLASYECTQEKKEEPKKTDTPPVKKTAEADPFGPQEFQKKKKGDFKGKGKGKGGFNNPNREVKSPDGKWTAFVKDHNAYLKKTGSDVVVQLTKDGEEKNAYGYFSWSPTSKTLVAFRTAPGDSPKAAILDSVPKGGGRPKVTEWNYRVPGDKVEARELWLFDIDKFQATKADVGKLDFGNAPPLHWRPNGEHFTFQYTHRGHERVRLIEVVAQTGKARDIIDEKAPRIVRAKTYIHYVDGSEDILWLSERDGWNHLYLIDGRSGTVKNQITEGEWLVHKVERVDGKARQVWFSAGGKNPGEDPYHVHHYRANFDGTGLLDLTQTDGNHVVAYSPDHTYLIDTYTRANLPAVTELRRAADGSLVCSLEKADVSPMTEAGLRLPEVFHAKGRDGKTDIWGVVYLPSSFSAAKKYPVIEYIYAGPWTSTAPKTFTGGAVRQALAELGFVVVVIDGMGTPNRSRAFHDMSVKNNGDCGLPDRILWMKALARERYPNLDLDRVGIYGHSGGGYSSLRALLTHPEFYKVAVSSSGNHDPRTYNLPYTEQWMGFPVGDAYKDQSNVTHAHKLQGKLFLIHGEIDNNVVPSMTTMRVVDALVKANKDFDLLIIPGRSHNITSPYVTRRTWDFFVRHLHGVEPPSANAAPAVKTTAKAGG